MSVTVVIPCHNASRWIRDALDSVLGQSPPPASVIVVDDGSTDDSASIVEEFGSSVTLICQSQQGACTARNVGLAQVTTPFVIFLDADDYLEGDFLAGAVEALSGNQADIVFSPFMSEKPDGSRRRIFHFEPLPGYRDVFGGWLDRYSQPPCSIVWRTDFVRSIGGWNEAVLKNQDGEIAMRAMLHAPRLAGFSTGLGIYRAHGEYSLSRRKDRDALRSELQAMRSLITAARGTVFQTGVGGFGVKLYILARGFFEIGEWELGKSALADARTVGLRGHPGSFKHRCLCHVFGLQTKTRLARMFR